MPVDRLGQRGGSFVADRLRSTPPSANPIAGPTTTTSPTSAPRRPIPPKPVPTLDAAGLPKPALPSGNAAAHHSPSLTTSSLSSALDGGKLDLLPRDGVIRSGVLRDAVFPTWQDDAAGRDLSSPEEMQRNDPLATQVWRLYSKAKSQLPNAERLENLTWRMMAMNLRKMELERQG